MAIKAELPLAFLAILLGCQAPATTQVTNATPLEGCPCTYQSDNWVEVVMGVVMPNRQLSIYIDGVCCFEGKLVTSAAIGVAKQIYCCPRNEQFTISVFDQSVNRTWSFEIDRKKGRHVIINYQDEGRATMIQSQSPFMFC